MAAPSNKKIEDNLLRAFEGSQEAAREFFIGLLEGPLYVPERYQTYPLSDSPKYPNDFVNILGVKDQDRVVVPVFSTPSLIKEWCGNQLSYKSLDGPRLLKLLPEEWWMIVNPGSTVEKEISPWEVDQLKGGENNIPALLEELFPRNIVETLEIDQLQEEDYLSLKQALIDYATGQREIAALFIVREEGLDLDEQKVSTILIGVETDCQTMEELETLKDRIKSVAGPLLIGEHPFKVFVGTNRQESLTLGVFKETHPFYCRQESKFRSFWKRFTGGSS